MIVINRLGPSYERINDHRDAALAHQRLYRALVEEGKIIATGRLDGEPIVGISLVAAGVDRPALRLLLENDPAVKVGIVIVEFREWQLQMGSLDR